MRVPEEFTTRSVDANSQDVDAPYKEFLTSGEPYASILKNNPWIRLPAAGADLEWDKGWYYDTTVGRKHPYWKDKGLPAATKDIHQLRRDFLKWGYCLIEDGTSPEQCSRLLERVSEQGAAERALGIAYEQPAQQHIWALVNKGEQFVQCMDHDPKAVQAGPLIARLLSEFIGKDWNHFSFISNVCHPGCHPQFLHQDQSFIAPYQTDDAPVLVNTVYILQDVNEENGGTLLIPGSHRPNGEGGEIYGALPRAINLEAKAGSILMMDGRVLHGGAVNRTDVSRYIITNSVVKPWVRQQENFLFTVSPEVLATASANFLMRVGFQATATRNMVEGFGYFGSGRTGDENGSLLHVRREIDGSGYRHLGVLGKGASIGSDSSLPKIQKEHETLRRKSE